MTLLPDIIRHIESLAGHRLNKDEGVHHGEAQVEITGATVAWMATPDAIEAAGSRGHQVLICHESLYFPYDVLIATQPPADWKSWKVNRQRRDLLDSHRLACLRVHACADEISIFDTFADQLGLGAPAIAEGLVKVYDIPEITLDDLVLHVKRRMGMPAVRVAGRKACKRRVKRVGLPWGGLGLFVNVAYQQKLAELGCDVFIAGESDNYGFRFAEENGIPMIETSHELCENPGLRRFTDVLAQAFPSVAFQFYENDCVWEIG
jgi:putative NIF3 family GTP cyclohydrolase 1 type 2